MRATPANASPPAPSGAETRGLARPDATQWLHEIARVVGPQQALIAWSRASQATSLHGTSLSPGQLETIGNRLLADAAGDGPLRVAVSSCLLRLRVWRTLERTRGGTP